MLKAQSCDPQTPRLILSQATREQTSCTVYNYSRCFAAGYDCYSFTVATTVTAIMTFYSVLFIAIVALSHLARAAEPRDNIIAAQLGRYPVSIYDYEVKTWRPDPLAPTSELRRLMVTVYRPFLDTFACPLEHQSQIPYAPPVVAAALLNTLLSSPNASSILALVKLVNCSRPVPKSSPSGPLLLFSPGYGGTHHGYTSILQAAASSGYTVVAIDHTYEAAAMIFPDGCVAYPSAVTDEYDKSVSGQNFLQAVRIADAVSVLDAIERGDVPGLGRYSNSSHNSSRGYNSGSKPAFSCKPLRAVIYGHSFGGSTAVNVAAPDARVLAAANIDSPYYKPVANGTMRKPLLMMQSASLPPATANWLIFYADHVRD